MVGHNAIRISPVVRRRRRRRGRGRRRRGGGRRRKRRGRLEGTTHGMLFTLNYSRHRGHDDGVLAASRLPHHPRKPTDILDKRCPDTKISGVQRSHSLGKRKRQRYTRQWSRLDQRGWRGRANSSSNLANFRFKVALRDRYFSLIFQIIIL